jgi:hypothetical protein
MIFASEDEIGYDPLITLVEGDPPSYIYQLGEKAEEARFFQTQRCISDLPSVCITGRTTRVWETVELDSRTREPLTGDLMVLKDVWLDGNAKTERVIQTEIFSDIAAFANSPSVDHPHLSGFTPEMRTHLTDVLQGEEYKKYFLHIECDFQGQTSKEVPSSALPQRGIFNVSEPRSVSSLRGLSAPISMDNSAEQDWYAPKRQYRLVYKELCEPLQHLDSLQDVFKVLCDCLVGKSCLFLHLAAVLYLTIGLQLLYCAGWVHRDISSGNVLVSRTSNPTILQGKLLDLEYAKKFLSNSGSSDLIVVSN